MTAAGTEQERTRRRRARPPDAEMGVVAEGEAPRRNVRIFQMILRIAE